MGLRLPFFQSLFQLCDRNSGFSLAKGAETEAAYVRMLFEMLLYFGTENACSLSVNYRQLMQSLHYRTVDSPVNINNSIYRILPLTSTSVTALCLVSRRTVLVELRFGVFTFSCLRSRILSSLTLVLIIPV